MAKRFGMQLFAALALSLLAAASAAAQQTGIITGRVTDIESSAGLAGANVEVITGTGRVIGGTLTDAQGNFRIPNVPVGTYSLNFKMVGYQTTRVPDIHVVAGETTMAGASLPSSAFLLNPIIVSASKRQEKALDAPASVSVVPKEEIEQRPTLSPVDHLRSTPGVDVITSGVQSTNVVVRGFNNIFSGALHTLTDNRIAGVPSLRVNFMHFIPQTNDDIERMEVVLGPGSALYGPNTANGVLHILTKSPLTEQGTIISVSPGYHSETTPADTGLAGIGSRSSGSNMLQATFRTAQKLGENFGVKISGQYTNADEFFYRDRSEDSTRLGLVALTTDAAILASPLFPPAMSLEQRKIRISRIANRNFDVERWSGDVRADWRATDKLLTTFSGGITNDNSIELTGIGAGQAVDWRYMYAQARATYGQLFAQTYVNMSDAGDTYLLRNGAPITDKSKVWVAQLQHGMNFGERQSFTYGGDYIKTMPNTQGTINGSREDDDNYDEYGLYLQSQTAVHRMFDVVLAGRYDKHSALDDAVLSPRAALVFKPTDEHTFRATFNRAFSTPTSLNLFLDLDAGGLGALGPLSFRAHAQAPGRAGISLHNADGTVSIRSPFLGNPANPATFQQRVAVAPLTIYNLQLEAIRRASPTVAGNPALVGYMQTLAAGAGGLRLVLDDPLTRKEVTFSAGAVADVEGIEESTTSTFELGYKGILGDRLLLAVDGWWSNHKNFTSPLIAATPLVRFDSLALRNYLTPLLTPVVGPANAAAIARGMAQLPAGVVSSADTHGEGAALILTYRNFGDIDISGFDVAATALLSDAFQLGVTASFVSDDFFNLPLGERDSTVVALNAPKTKGSATLGYRNTGRGLNGELRVRYQDEFPANSAGFVGLKCVDAALAGECVPSFTLVDVSLGYRLPFPGASVQLAVTNVLDEEYRSFIGTPTIGRLAMLRLKYEF